MGIWQSQTVIKWTSVTHDLCRTVDVYCRPEQLLGARNAGKDDTERQKTGSMLHSQRPQQDWQPARRPAKGLTITYSMIQALIAILDQRIPKYTFPAPLGVTVWLAK